MKTTILILSFFALIAATGNMAVSSDTIRHDNNGRENIPFQYNESGSLFSGAFAVSPDYFAELALHMATGKLTVVINGCETLCELSMPEDPEVYLPMLCITTEDLNGDGYVDFTLTPNCSAHFPESYMHIFDSVKKCFVALRDDENAGGEEYIHLEVTEHTDKITIDRAYHKPKKGVKTIQWDDSEYYKYGIPLLNTLGMRPDDRFVWDDTHIFFSIIAEIKLYGNIHSLIIRGDKELRQGEREYAMGIWLVNYDMNNKLPGGIDFYTYIDSFPIGHTGEDDWGESTGLTASVIYLLPEPYIEQEYVNGEEKENSRIEILESGKFNVTQTVRSKYEM